MKKTNERILDTALKLFNARGLSKVSLRTIAKEMGISQGNLNYHYKKREDIIEALYFQLVKNIDESMATTLSMKPGLELLLYSSKTIMNNFFDYRFFFLDFVQIIRENPGIKTHYFKLTKIREMQFTGLFDLLVAEGLMRKEQLADEYLFLYRRLQIMGDFWISSAAVTPTRITKKTVSEYSAIITQSIYPYLTAKGRRAYHAIIV